MQRRRLVAALLVPLGGCVTTRSLGQVAPDERAVTVTEPDSDERLTLGEVAGTVRAAGARIVRMQAVGTLSTLTYEPTAIGPEESITVAADAFADHVASGFRTSRFEGVVVDTTGAPVFDYFVLSRWADELNTGSLSPAGYHERVRETVTRS